MSNDVHEKAPAKRAFLGYPNGQVRRAACGFLYRSCPCSVIGKNGRSACEAVAMRSSLPRSNVTNVQHYTIDL